MRAFVCSYLDATHQQHGREVVDALNDASGGRLRAVPTDTAHLTYAFIASLPDEHLPGLVQAVTRVAADTPAIAVVIGAPEVLYGGSEARLVYLPVIEGQDPLAALAGTLTDAAREALPGVDVTLTPAPHVTIARFRRGTRRREARQVEEVIARDLGGARLPLIVAAVQVVESELTTSGPRYVVRATAPLRS